MTMTPKQMQLKLACGHGLGKNRMLLTVITLVQHALVSFCCPQLLHVVPVVASINEDNLQHKACLRQVIIKRSHSVLLPPSRPSHNCLLPRRRRTPGESLYSCRSDREGRDTLPLQSMCLQYSFCLKQAFKVMCHTPPSSLTSA